MGRKKLNLLKLVNNFINIEEEKKKIEKIKQEFVKNNGIIHYI
jgi:hypothetical protein